MRTVYIETTIPSYYHDTRATVAVWRSATRDWWAQAQGAYRLVTSAFTIAELQAAPPPKRDQALALLAGVEVLPDSAGLADVVAAYIEHHLMPAEASGDAGHLAMASLHGVDFLLTWNIRHLANANKFQHLHIINGRLGLPVPAIVTPLNLPPEAQS